MEWNGYVLLFGMRDRIVCIWCRNGEIITYMLVLITIGSTLTSTDAYSRKSSTANCSKKKIL